MNEIKWTLGDQIVQISSPPPPPPFVKHVLAPQNEFCMQKSTWSNYKRSGIWVDPPPPVFFQNFHIFPFFLGDVPNRSFFPRKVSLMTGGSCRCGRVTMIGAAPADRWLREKAVNTSRLWISCNPASGQSVVTRECCDGEEYWVIVNKKNIFLTYHLSGSVVSQPPGRA